jgi:hypothetical protein
VTKTAGPAELPATVAARVADKTGPGRINAFVCGVAATLELRAPLDAPGERAAGVDASANGWVR